MSSLAQLQHLLRTLFQLDLSDLDFGLYRLFRLKRAEIEAFISEQLPRQVEAAFAEVVGQETDLTRRRYERCRQELLEKLGENALLPDGRVAPDKRENALQFPATRPLVTDYEAARERYQVIEVTEGHKAEVFNHLVAFFGRYYEEGDFIPKRRYGMREAYAVPYRGQEVFFHWANHDQHYVKTAERFQDYAFIVEDLTGEYRVRFTMAAASIAPDNTKGSTRFFFPRPGLAAYDAEDRLFTLPFEYRLPTPEEADRYGRNSSAQEAILEEARPRILEAAADENLRALLARPADESEGAPAVLLKRLRHFCRRNTSDYFIHRDLRGFMSRELEFYVKDQVLHLLDLEADLDAKRRVVRTFRRLAEKVIDFLAAIEEAQKVLFEKKKFVLHSDYLVPMGYVPGEFWGEILRNQDQLAEWERWGLLNPQNTLFNPSGAVNEAFLERHPSLPLHTRHFGRDFVRRLLEALPFDDLDAATDGLLVHGENYQALNLLGERYRGRVRCVYIDPPYNTGGDGFVYKDRYQHSSWLAMMSERVSLGRTFLRSNGSFLASIDDIESSRLRAILDQTFGEENFIDTVVWKKRYGGGAKEKHLVTLQEYILFFAKHEPSLGNIFVPLDSKSVKRYYKHRDANFGIRGPYRTHPLEATRSVDIRPNLVYPIPAPNGTEIWPERQWWWERDRTMRALENNELEFVKTASGWTVHTKQYLKDENGVERQAKAFSMIDNIYTQHGAAEIENLFGDSRVYTFSKPASLVAQLVRVSQASTNDLILDFFAGSGTTGHAVVALNREDGGRRRFILVEMADYFDTVLLPRLAKVMYSPEWKDGRPRREASAEEAGRGPRLVKILRLESYEDALHNLAATVERLADDPAAQRREAAYKALAGEDAYRLRYWIELPLREAATCLRALDLAHPFAYTLETLSDDGPVQKPVDLVETFNSLYGLRVRRYETWHDQGDHKGRPYQVVKASDREGRRRILVIWRDAADLDPARERAFLEDRITAMADEGEVWDEIRINGDSPTPRVTSLDPLFKQLMTQGQGG